MTRLHGKSERCLAQLAAQHGDVMSPLRLAESRGAVSDYLGHFSKNRWGHKIDALIQNASRQDHHALQARTEVGCAHAMDAPRIDHVVLGHTLRAFSLAQIGSQRDAQWHINMAGTVLDECSLDVRTRRAEVDRTAARIKSMPLRCVDRLPDEIWLRIFQSFGFKDRLPLLTLRRVNRQWRRVAGDNVLWQHVVYVRETSTPRANVLAAFAKRYAKMTPAEKDLLRTLPASSPTWVRKACARYPDNYDLLLMGMRWFGKYVVEQALTRRPATAHLTRQIAAREERFDLQQNPSSLAMMPAHRN